MDRNRRDKIIEARNRGLSYKQISQHLKIPFGSVVYYLNDKQQQRIASNQRIRQKALKMLLKNHIDEFKSLVSLIRDQSKYSKISEMISNDKSDAPISGNL